MLIYIVLLGLNAFFIGIKVGFVLTVYLDNIQNICFYSYKKFTKKAINILYFLIAF